MAPDYIKIFTSSPDLYLLLSTDLNILGVTDALLKVLNKNREQVEGHHVLDLFSKQEKNTFSYSQEEWTESIQHMTHHKAPHEMDLQRLEVETQEGSFQETYWRPTNTPVLDDRENVLYIIHRVENITETIRAKAEADIRRHWLHYSFMHAPAGISIMQGKNLIFEFANEPFRKLVGKNRPLLRKPLQEAIPDFEPELLSILHRVYETGKPFFGKEYPVVADWNSDENPNARYFDFSLIAIPDETSQKTDRLIAFVYEVTELVAAKKKAEENLSLFKNLVETIPQIVWTGTPDGRVNFFSQRWFTYTQLSYEESKDAGWKSAIHPEDIQQTLARSDYARGTGNIFETRYRLRRGEDGMYRWHLSRSVPVYDTHGEIFLWVGTATDIHDNKVFEEKLEMKNKELEIINADLDNFVYTASHDLKSPLANMEGLIHALRKTALNRLNDKETQMFTMIETSIYKLKKTIEDLTEITRIQKDSGSAVEPVSVRDIIEEVKEDIATLIETSGVLIHEELYVAEFNYSKSHVRSILYNLLSNAIKYRSPDRRLNINIQTYREDGYIILCIHDNGLGLSQSQKSRLFTIFKRFHPKIEGTGIGLYMIKRTIENKGGKIEVFSSENQGSTFKVYLKDQ